jgi:ankyrin repeat protein
LWGEIKDRYFLKLLDVGLNKIPFCSKPIDELSDKECDAWIKESLLTTNDEASREASYQVDIPQLEREFPLMGKSEYLILPLSLENNSTLTGTASILEQFSREFKIPCKHASRHFVFDETDKCYDLTSARKHHEFMIMLFNHRKNSLAIDQQIRSTEKTIVDESNESMRGEDGEPNEIPAETIESTTRFFQQQDGKLTKLYNRINNDMINAMQSRGDEQLNKLVKKLQDTQDEWENVTDHLGRSILHYAVEYNNIPLVKTLISCILNINVQEGCGATPLSIAVLNRNSVMCELLVQNFASFSGPLFAGMPSPIEMAENMELTDGDILELFQCQEKEDDDIDNIINDGSNFCSDVLMETSSNDGDGDDTVCVAFDRSAHVQCPTAIVGDQGTCKILRSAKNRSQEAFKWVAEVPGDLHTKGYLCEAAYKA